MFYLVVVFVGLLLLTLNFGLAIFSPDTRKSIPFECGFIGHQQSRQPFKVSFLIVGILFLLFDVELSFVYPLLSAGFDINWVKVFHVSLFLGLLSLGLIYEILWSMFKNEI